MNDVQELNRAAQATSIQVRRTLPHASKVTPSARLSSQARQMRSTNGI
jgi:hypothetical protein